MNIISWNCRGLGNPRSVQDFRRLVKEKRPNLVFLMETKLRKYKLENIRVKVGFTNMFVVDCVGKSGGLALFWDDGWEVEVQNYSHRHINAIVHNQNNGLDWKFTGFYGHPNPAKRHEAWDLLKHLAHLTPNPWICIGDFNEILTMSEKLGGKLRHNNLMEAFRQTLEACGLTDLGFIGPKFTWSNCQEGIGLIKERLDRGVCNIAWRTMFPDSQINVGAAISSDHAPLVLRLLGSQGQAKKRPRFFYDSCWALDKGYQEVMAKSWLQGDTTVTDWESFSSKLAVCVENVLTWRKEINSTTQGAIEKMQRRLLLLQTREDDSAENEIKKLKFDLHGLLDKEELWWRQRAKEEWLKLGDRNTKFFHACANSRRRRNFVGRITDVDGLTWDNETAIEGAFVSYFSNLFTTGPAGDYSPCLQPITSRVTEGMNSELLQAFTAKEIREALFQMAPFKAPGPDGLNACFFQKNWPTMGEEVCGVLLGILNSGDMPTALNLTHVTLVPKLNNPSSVTEFRPISLCNVLYKILSKVLANRLKKLLPLIIDPTQSAFIPGRLITDNVLAAYETLHTMHSGMRGKKGFMAVKLDMSKAYDRVEWGFLEAVMKRMGFDGRWISLIMMCVKSVQYSILVNGNPCGLITPSRGIRQGDPISPYLFLICAEALSAMLTHANMDGRLTGVPTSRRGPALSHLFFADDSLLFCRATLSQWNQLTSILQKYEEASGQKMNTNKTALFFSRNTSHVDKEQIQGVAGIPSNQRYDTYLGLPALVGRSRTSTFKSIKERVWKRLQDWKLKFLSTAGKEILLKAVIQAIPTYCMGVFRIPKALCKEINSLMMRFFWGHKENEKRIHWMSWNKMGISKKHGGMGFRDLVCFNKALLAKQIWRLWKNPDSLIARIMKAKYYPKCSVLEASLGNRPSFAWRSIQGASDLIKGGLIWRVGNGKKVRIWKDKWLPTPSTYMMQSPPLILDPNATVSQLVDAETKGWNFVLLERLFSREEIISIQSVPLSITNQEDALIWRGTKKGIFTVRSAYFLEKEREMATKPEGSSRTRQSSIWKLIWQQQMPNAEKHFLWRACHEILPTKANLCTRKVLLEPRCPICEREEETVVHALWQCPAARDVWSAGNIKFQKSNHGGQTFLQVAEDMVSICDQKEFAYFVSIARRIWLRRNEKIHGGGFLHPNTLVQQATQAVDLFNQVGDETVVKESAAGVPTPTPWKHPPVGWFKANWDAGVNHKTGRVGLGAIIRDHQGRMWAAKSMTQKGSLDPIAAETIAATMAAKLCKEMGIRQVLLEGDAKEVVEAVKSHLPDESATGHLTADLRVALSLIPVWEVGHVRRVSNNVAHVLASLALREDIDRVWLYDPPDCIREIMYAEIPSLQDLN
jgi:ribonuclease HI